MAAGTIAVRIEHLSFYVDGPNVKSNAGYSFSVEDKNGKTHGRTGTVNTDHGTKAAAGAKTLQDLRGEAIASVKVAESMVGGDTVSF